MTPYLKSLRLHTVLPGQLPSQRHCCCLMFCTSQSYVQKPSIRIHDIKMKLHMGSVSDDAYTIYPINLTVPCPEEDVGSFFFCLCACVGGILSIARIKPGHRKQVTSADRELRKQWCCEWKLEKTMSQIRFVETAEDATDIRCVPLSGRLAAVRCRVMDVWMRIDMSIPLHTVSLRPVDRQQHLYRDEMPSILEAILLCAKSMYPRLASSSRCT